MMKYKGVSGKVLLAKKIKKCKNFNLYAVYDGKRFLYNTAIVERRVTKPKKAE